MSEMHYCMKCKKEMLIKKTGLKVIFNESYVYSSDLFRCPQCGNETIQTCKEGKHYSHPISNEDIEGETYIKIEPPSDVEYDIANGEF